MQKICKTCKSVKKSANLKKSVNPFKKTCKSVKSYKNAETCKSVKTRKFVKTCKNR